MRQVRRTSQFKADVKRMEKRGKDFTEFKAIIIKLVSGQELEVEYRDHVSPVSTKGPGNVTSNQIGS